MKVKLSMLLLFIGIAGSAEQVLPPDTWKDAPNPLASADAEVGGEISIFAGPNPQSFNYYLDNNMFSAQVFSLMYETLLSRNPLTLDDEPGLAEKWSISDDKKTFTFWIDKRARWSDGKSITAADVKWTFDAIMDPKNLTGVHKVSLEVFQPPVVVSDYEIRFTAKAVHWKNLMAVGGFQILPRHIFREKDFNKINFEFPVISGLYKLGDIKEGIYATLERRSDWWARDLLRNQGTGNFQTVKFKFFAERENAFESFLKGQIDLYPVYTSHLWINKTTGEKFDRNWIIKQKIFNRQPTGFQGFAMNMRKPPFDDGRVRKAMAHLLNREKMNSSLMYSQYFLHRSYVEDLYSKTTPCPNPLIEFDKGTARTLLDAAGWIVNPKTGIREKNGAPFHFKFLTRSATSEKFLSVYAEDLKDVGVRLEIDKKDWAAWSKDMDQFNYSMTWAAWSGGTFKDPEGMWAAKEADRRAGNNVTGFKNERVDELIEQQKTIFNIEKRNAINREIDQIVYDQFPYVLLWNINYTRLLYWSKFGTPETVLSKFGSEGSAYSYWWFDEDSAAGLDDAIESKLSLPNKPDSVVFDEVFEGH